MIGQGGALIVGWHRAVQRRRKHEFAINLTLTVFGSEESNREGRTGICLSFAVAQTA